MYALTREQAKKQCEIEAAEDAHDEWFDEAIAEAHDYVEQYLQASLTESRWIYRTNRWPYDQPPYELRLPMGPLQGVIQVSYLDIDGERQTLEPGTDYEFMEGQAGYIVPAFGEAWPAARDMPNSIAVEYWAGYPGQGSPADASGVPKAIVRAMKMLVGHWFENREAMVIGTITDEIALGMRDALQPYRNYP